MENDLKEMDGTFFTKDKVQVHTVYFENVPDAKNVVKELDEFFSKYGEICQLDIEKLYKTFSDESKVSGTVQYYKPESAYKVLNQELNNNNNYIVLPADSWVQPTILNNQLDSIKKSENHCTLLDLGEDLLMLLFSKLVLRDMITLASTFPSIKPTIKQYYKCEKKIKLNYKEINNFTLMQIREFLIENSEVLEDLEILEWHYNVTSIRLLNFALHFCKNLKSLHISSISFKNKEFSKMISKKFAKLENLKLIDCRLDDQDIKFLVQLKFLKILDLSGSNNSFTGTCLCEFNNLNELHLENCEDLLSVNLSKIDFTNLKVLNISGCHVLDCSFKTISECSRKLNTLKMSFSKLDNNQFENFVTRIESLEQLVFVNVSRTGCTGFYIDIPGIDNRIKKLSESEYLKNNLQVLHLVDFKLNEKCFEYIVKFNNLIEIMFGVSHENPVALEFWVILDSLKKLETLAIKIDGFKSLGAEFIIKLIEYLSKKEIKKCFTLRVEISKLIYNDILKNSLYLQYKDTIKVIPFYLTEPYSHHALNETVP